MTIRPSFRNLIGFQRSSESGSHSFEWLFSWPRNSDNCHCYVGLHVLKTYLLPAFSSFCCGFQHKYNLRSFFKIGDISVWLIEVIFFVHSHQPHQIPICTGSLPQLFPTTRERFLLVKMFFIKKTVLWWHFYFLSLRALLWLEAALIGPRSILNPLKDSK